MAISKKAAEGLEEHELWLQFVNRKDNGSRQALALHYTPWVRQIARQVFLRWQMPGAEWADYVHYGTLGLLESIDRFDSTRGAQFQTYARYRVKGAIINGIKTFTPAAVEASGSTARDRTASLLDAERHDPLEEVVAVSVGLAIGHFLDIESIQAPAEEQPDSYAQLERGEMQTILKDFVDQLPDKERLIVTFHYLQQLPFVEIAEHLNLSKGRVSQLHKRAIERIRKQLQTVQMWDITV